MALTNWTRQQMFQWMHGSNLVYNQCWEDPRLDRQAFQIQPTDNVALITSAGCNALDYLLDNPNSVDAIDMNPRQNALLELKKAAIMKLEYEDFYAIFGLGIHLGIDRIYKQALRPELPEFARAYWDKHIDFFLPKGIHRGFYYRGSAGWVARIMGEYISLRGLSAHLEKIFNVSTLQEQAQIYFNDLKPHFWNKGLRWFTRRGALMSALGVPRSQFEQIEDYYIGGMAKFIEDCLDSVFSQLPLKDNYFYHLYLFGHYTESCSPEYLKRHNYPILRERVERLNTHNASLIDYFNSTDKTLHKVTLLDHMDWLYKNQRDLLRDQWDKLVSLSNETTKILWRSASLNVDFIDPLVLSCGRTLGQVLHYDVDLAAELHKKDRVHTYGSFYIAGVQT
jgi:S-adenosylmethionine-diacylglycerol 3-amino-3-carboxypropyl transferase